MRIQATLAIRSILAGVVTVGCHSGPDGSALGQVPADPPAVSWMTGSDSAHGVTIRAEASRDARSEVTLRRLSTSGYVDFYASSISPDGRYLSMIDWSTSNLAVRDLTTGEVHRLTDVQNEEGKPYEGAGVSVFSPDGRRILSSWEYDGSCCQLRVIDFEPDAAGVPSAAEPAVIFHNPELTPYFLFDWSPDGSQVLAKVYTAGNSNQLALISTSDGTYRALKSFDWREPDRAGFSPDGRYVAYDFQPELDSPTSDVFVVSVDGTYEATVVDGPATDGLLGWHPDGAILFYSDRGGSRGVWRMPMADGRPAGPAELVRADMLGIEPLGFAENRFYYGVNVNPVRLYTVAVDFAAGKRIGAPVPVDDPARIRRWAWSPDGKFLAYSRPGAGALLIVIRSDRGQEVKAFALDLRATRQIRWDPDGRSLMVYADDSKDRPGFRRIDLEAGSYTTILRNDQLQDPTPRGHFDISPDGRTIWFATSALDDVRWSLIAYDLHSGASRSITPVEWRVRGDAMSWWLGQISVSPDGAKLAVLAPDTTAGDPWVGTIPVEGGPFTPLARLDGYFFGPEWTADGRSIVIWTGSPGQWTGWLVPADGGEPRPLELMEHVFPRGMKLHPDGRRIAFLAGESRGEVWVMDGLGTNTVASREEGSR